MVGDKNLGGEAQYAEAERISERRPAGHEPHRLAHGGEVGGDVDGVGDDQQRDEDIKNPRRQSLRDIAGKSAAGLPAEIAADDLDRRHERQRQQHAPGEREAKLRAGLRIGGDPAWIVIGGSGGQPGAESVP